MLEIIPSPGTEKDWEIIEQKIERIKPVTKILHIDIVDGIFAPNTTFLNPKPFQKYANDFFLELHMMVKNPIEYLLPWAAVGVKRFIGHIEQMPNQQTFLEAAKQYGEAGLAIDGPTNIKMLDPEANPDCILVMTIQAGFSGQDFQEKQLAKITEIKNTFHIPIEVDGGINAETIIKAKNAGAVRFVTTSYIFDSQNPQETVSLLQKKIS